MTEPIRGRVARLFNSRQLALNVGRQNGVASGTLFDILDPAYEDITDPETGEILGSIDQAKVRVEVTKVEDRVCLATTGVKHRVNVGGGGASMDAIGRLFAPQKWIEVYERLDKRPEGTEHIDEVGSYVKVGDPAIQVIEASEEKEVDAQERASDSEESPPPA